MKNEESQKHLFEYHIKNTQILLYSLIFALIIGITGMAFSIKQMNVELETKSYQINLLVDEVGEIKNENQYLYQSITENNNKTLQSFEAMNEIYLILQEYVEGKFNEKLQINYNNLKNLTQLINEREVALKQLQNRNNQLSNELEIKKTNEQLLNFLILGTDGHLTDTIILASVNTKNESIVLVSIPRDLYINGRKINSVLSAYGIEKLKRDFYSVTGIYPDKHIVVDIDGFKNVIDTIGGIEIEVTKNIRDPYFPTDSNGYKVYSVDKGLHQMTGDEVLMYARSRKTTSDFDRAERQQQIIKAIRARLDEINMIRNLEKAKDLLLIFVENVDTNIDLFEALFYIKSYQDYRIESGNLISTNNLLYDLRTSDGQYILLPKSGGFHDIKKHISQLIQGV